MCSIRAIAAIFLTALFIVACASTTSSPTVTERNNASSVSADSGKSSTLVSFPTQDGGLIYADIYGSGERGVVLAHGGQFNRKSWEKQALTLAASGFQVLALDFRGFGLSRGPSQSSPLNAPLHLDVLAAVRYLRTTGATTVSVVGGSLGGDAAADASIEGDPGEIDRLVLSGTGSGNLPPEKIRGRKLIITSANDANDGGLRLPGIREAFNKMAEPKELIVVTGSAHAQFMFQTDQGERVMQEIVRFLSAP